MENPIRPEKIEVDESGEGPVELYDDFAPPEPPRLNMFGTMLVSVLLKEVNATLQEVNLVLAAIEQLERNTGPRQTVSGEYIPSAYGEAFIQMIKRSGLEETVREQLTRLQGSAFRANLEYTLRQYWHTLSERSRELRETLKQTNPPPVKIKPEEYVSQENNPVAGYNPPAQPAENNEVAPAAIPTRELLVDIFDEPATGEIVLVAEHPGLQANSIRVSLAHDILNLSAADFNGEVYSKECLLPGPVEPNTLAQQYRNGVLEVRLKRAEG